MTDVAMPKLSESMEQGMIISWFKSNGDAVAVGDELVEIETDKATVAYAAEIAGVLEIVVPVGSVAQVGEPIARIGAVGTASVPDGRQPVSTAATEAAGNGAGGGDAEAVATPVLAESPKASVAPASNGHSSDVKATPLARRVAAAHGIVLDSVHGTGPLGRVTRADVLKQAGVAVPAPQRTHAPAPSVPSVPAVSRESSTPSSAGSRRQELSRLQQVIARRMSEAKATIPHFQVQTEVAMDATIGLRNELKSFATDAQPVPSINDLIIKAAAMALLSHPLANGSYADGAFELHDAINVGFAVAAEGALVVPTVFHADAKSLGEIAVETRRLATSVREGTITPPDLSGGTFTVSNLGMFGMTAITPVINPPQAAILGVGAHRAVLARVGEQIVERTLATLTLSCDHRILYGADAARFLSQIREFLEEPLRLLL